MKRIKFLSIGAAGLMLGCSGNDGDEPKIINVAAPKGESTITRRNTDVSSGAPQISSGTTSGSSQGFEELMGKAGQPQKKSSSYEEESRKHEAEQKALDRAHEALMLDKKSAAEEKKSIMQLFSDAMAASLMLKMANPDPCANESFINGLADLGKSLGDGLAATKKGLNDQDSATLKVQQPGEFVGPIAPISAPGSSNSTAIPTTTTAAPTIIVVPAIQDGAAPPPPISPAETPPNSTQIADPTQRPENPPPSGAAAENKTES